MNVLQSLRGFQFACLLFFATFACSKEAEQATQPVDAMTDSMADHPESAETTSHPPHDTFTEASTDAGSEVKDSAHFHEANVEDTDTAIAVLDSPPETDGTVADVADGPMLLPDTTVTDIGCAIEEAGMGTCTGALLSSTPGAVSCNTRIDKWSDEGNAHVETCTSLKFCTQPPSSGAHFPIWASFRAYSQPIPYGYMVHSLELGAVYIGYNCAKTSLPCTDVRTQIDAIVAALPQDPACDGDSGPKRRVIVAPDPALATVIGASAWAWTYRSDCIEGSTLTQFVNDHYGKTIENFCLDGIVPPGITP